MSTPSEPAARFFDGRSARAHEVRLDLTGIALEIRDTQAHVLGVWPWRKIRVVGHHGGMRLALGHSSPRLIVADPGLARQVRAHLPSAWPKRLRLAGALLVSAAGLAALAYVLIWALPPYAARFIPDRYAVRLGDMVLSSLARDARFCVGEGLSALRGQLAPALARAAVAEGEDPPTPRVHVLALNAANAFALPGGTIVLTGALIRRASGPDAVAGVLAHELGHVLERHPEQEMVRALGIQSLGLLLAAGSADVGGVLNAGVLLASLRYNREQERAADVWARRLLGRASIGGEGTARLLEQLERETGSALSFLSTHPGARERAAALRALPPGASPVLTDSAWEALRGVCDVTRAGP